MTRPVRVAPSGRVDTMGVRFHPWAASRSLGAPASEVTGRIDPADDHLHGAELSRLRSTEDGSERLRLLESLVRDRARRSRAADPSVAAVARRILASGGATSIAALAERCGVGLRSLERSFLAAVGLPPKRFASLARFQEVFRALESERSWAEVALACGYFDQAHLIRDFRRYAGETPEALRREDLTEAFLRKDRASHSYNLEAARPG